jgi:hypothetical protein
MGQRQQNIDRSSSYTSSSSEDRNYMGASWRLSGAGGQWRRQQQCISHRCRRRSSNSIWRGMLKYR